MEAVWWALVVVVVGALAWVGFRMESHWSAKDGKAFTCRLQAIGTYGLADGRWHDARAVIDDYDNLVIRTRGGLNPTKQPMQYRVVSRSATPPKGLAVYVIENSGSGARSSSEPRSGSGRGDGRRSARMDVATLRIPLTSRAVEHLDGLVDR